MKHIFCILFTFFTVSFYAQKSFTVYFETDSHQLTLSELNRLDNAFKIKTLKLFLLQVFAILEHHQNIMIVWQKIEPNL